LREETATIVEDCHGTLRHRRSGRRSYLVGLPLVALVAAVAVAGFLGPKANQPTAAGPSPLATTSPQPTAVAVSEPSAEPTSPLGLAQITIAARSVNSVHLPMPGGYSSDLPVAVAGSNVYLAEYGTLYRVDLATGSMVVLKEFGSQPVLALAASGERLAVLIIGEPPPGDPKCESYACDVRYEVWLLRSDGSSARRADAFVSRGGIAPQLALGTDSWALSLGTPREGDPGHTATTIRVRSDAGKLLWSSWFDRYVDRLALGGTRLIAVLRVPEESADQCCFATDIRTGDSSGGLWGNTASLSSDGRFVTWADGPCIDTFEAAPASTTGICPTGIGMSYFAPSVDVDTNASMNMAWLALGGGRVSLVVRSAYLPEPVVVGNAVNPSWAIVRGSTVYWGVPDQFGLEVFAVDLSTDTYRQD
jgi:hypothetical protein